MHRFSGLLLAVLLLHSAFANATGTWRRTGNLTSGYDSNSNNGVKGNVQLESLLYSGDAGLEYRYGFTPQTSIAFKAVLAGEWYQRFEGLGNARLTGMVRLRHRLADVVGAPSVNVWGSAAYWQFQDDLRDSQEYRLGVFLDQPLGGSFNLRAGVSATERLAERGDFFDLSTHAVNAQVDWRALDALTLYAEYQFRSGDLTSTDTPDPKLRAATTVRGPDTAFAETGADMIIYRLDGRTHVAALGGNVGISSNLSVDGRLQYVYSEADGGLEYARWIGVISLLAQF